jgi:Ser/Thr protein kinase RdoA (MazF antagonist)
MNEPATPPYAGLTPDIVLDALEHIGLRCDGRQLALNSYENRVYQVGLEEQSSADHLAPLAPVNVSGPLLPAQPPGPSSPVIAKFYRPERWSDEQILEEHAFTLELAEREIPVVAPLEFAGRTLHSFAGFRFAVYPRRGGRAPELDNPDTLEWLGRFIGRIHAIGAIKPFAQRPALDIESFGLEPREYLLTHAFIPPDLVEAWRSATDQALEAVRACYARAGEVRNIRLHGDCHIGNVLWTEMGSATGAAGGPHFVDFDDSRMGPAVQDLWMLLSGDARAMSLQMEDVLAGYEDFCEFDPRELHLIEALRTLRLIHYSAWLARRWHDPAFPAAFPWFGTQRYWQDRVLELREQIAAMQEAPIARMR